MAGLLDGFLPWAFSTGNTIKRNVRGLLTDPVSFGGSLMQDLQTQNQQRSQDFGTLFQPGVFTSPQDKQQAMTRATQEAVNYAAPTVWHGSPHKFDKFDSSKIGTGEGAQAYGHGLYLAESPGVAKSYADKLSGIDGYKPEVADAVFRRLAEDSVHGKDAISWGAFASKTNQQQFRNVFAANPAGTWEKVPPKIRSSVEKEFEGNMYKVDLPDSAVAKMLDWDKPLSQQPEAVRVAAMDLGLPKTATGKDIYNALANQSRDMAIIRGQNANTTLGASQSAASDSLREFGIPGIRYLDGGSRGAGTGTRNYVVFPGGEGMLRILERNGQGLLGR